MSPTEPARPQPRLKEGALDALLRAKGVIEGTLASESLSDCERRLTDARAAEAAASQQVFDIVNGNSSEDFRSGLRRWSRASTKARWAELAVELKHKGR